MNKLIWKFTLVIFFVFFANNTYSSPKFYPIETAKNRTAFSMGYGLGSGVIGLKLLHWMKEPNVIVSFAMGVEAYVPSVRFPLLNFNNTDFYFAMNGLFTPGLLGIVSGDDEGIILSKDSFLLGTGFGIQRWLRKKSDYGLYLSVGMTYWLRVTGQYENNGDIAWSPDFQIGVVY